MYIGGQFWDGRANSLADQAGGPFLNPVEMAMPHLPQKTAVVMRLSENPEYVKMFKEVYSIDLSILDFNKAKAQADVNMDAPGVLIAYELMTEAIGAFEKSSEVNQFDSKFDYFRAGQAQLTAEEWKGLRLFEGKALCSECHITEPLVAPDGSEIPPLLTDFTYDNLGLPVNPKIAELIGEERPIDYGLGGREDIAAMDPDGLQLGKFKVPTLRNIGLTAPYGHNGLFPTLEQIVHFYNTRDVLDVCAGPDDAGFGDTCWPAPEVQQNVNVDELGDLGLTEDEEAALVAFMLTLSDGWGKANGMEPLPQPVMPPLPK
jgi:cytochrome c peroxidase